VAPGRGVKPPPPRLRAASRALLRRTPARHPSDSRALSARRAGPGIIAAETVSICFTMLHVRSRGHRLSLHRNVWLAAALLAVATAQAQQPAGGAAAAPSRELLNSERIEQKFGSYGIAVLAADGRVRVSSLFSGDGTAADPKICRTFAVVRYPESVAPSFAVEHAEIVKGGSIGAVFAAHGWRVLKTHLYFGETAASDRVAALMQIASGTPIALHAYLLEVEKDGVTLDYAALVEIHHPNYLSLADLRDVYGTPNAAGHESLLATLLATAEEAAHLP
jgi:hypothetical protein